MNNKKCSKLTRKFPLLYASAPHIECGDGWYEVIYKLSSKLESLIEETSRQITSCFVCRCEKDEHKNDSCAKVHIVPARINLSKKAKTKFKYKIYSAIDNVVNKFLSFFHVKRRVSCFCRGFELNHPRAIQIKEKLGTLRFYMSSQTKEMGALILDAERESSETCEACGRKGTHTSTSSGWLKVVCNTCSEVE